MMIEPKAPPMIECAACGAEFEWEEGRELCDDDECKIFVKAMRRIERVARLAPEHMAELNQAIGMARSAYRTVASEGRHGR